MSTWLIIVIPVTSFVDEQPCTNQPHMFWNEIHWHGCCLQRNPQIQCQNGLAGLSHLMLPVCFTGAEKKITGTWNAGWSKPKPSKESLIESIPS